VSTTSTSSGQSTSGTQSSNYFGDFLNKVLNLGGPDPAAAEAKRKAALGELNSQIQGLATDGTLTPAQRKERLESTLGTMNQWTDGEWSRDQRGADAQLSRITTGLNTGLDVKNRGLTHETSEQIRQRNAATGNVLQVQQAGSDNEFRQNQLSADVMKGFGNTYERVEMARMDLARQQLEANRTKPFDRVLDRIVQGAALILPFVT
jgi:hypothetical protein